MKTKKIMIQHLLPVILFLFTLTACHNVLATNVSGTIVNGNWTSNNSPYVVVGDINVAGLTIGPGVMVNFATNYSFEVDGVLTALGTPNAPIVFMGTNGGWQGIYFNFSSPGSILANCVIGNSTTTGIQISSSSPSISACTISNNFGGGIWTDTPLTLKECNIINNVASGITVLGAGIYSTATLTLIGCTISGNQIIASASDSAAYAYGAGIYCSTNVTLQWCQVEGNSGSVSCPGYTPLSHGGGVDCHYLTAENCIIRSNSISTVSDPGPSPSYAQGGGVFLDYLWATNSIFDHNSSYAAGSGSSPDHGGYSQGAGIYIVTSAQIANCTIAYNTATAIGGPPVSQGSGIFSTAASSNNVEVINSILWGGVPDQIYGPATVNWSDVQNGYSGTNNINHNPVFLSTTDLIIVPGSPCINAGNTNAIYNNVYFPPSLGVGGNDMGAHGGPGAGASLGIVVWPPAEVFFYGGVPGYDYLIQASTDLLNWQTVEPVSIANLGDIASFIEPSTNTLPYRFYKLNLAP
jgi:Right handed beta helix region